MKGDACYERKFDGMDFWAICLEGRSPGALPEYEGMMGKPYEQIFRPSTTEEFWNTRVLILLQIVKKMVEKGNIVPPEGFAEMFDFKTAVAAGNANIEDPNYPYARGFPAQWYDDNSPSVYPITSLSETSPIHNFRQYLHNAMIFTREQMLEKYAKFPNIIENYDYIVNYMKTQYGWDVATIAER